MIMTFLYVIYSNNLYALALNTILSLSYLNSALVQRIHGQSWYLGPNDINGNKSLIPLDSCNTLRTLNTPIGEDETLAFLLIWKQEEERKTYAYVYVRIARDQYSLSDFAQFCLIFLMRLVSLDVYSEHII